MNRKDISRPVDIKDIENGTDVMLDFDKLAKIAACGTPVVPVAVQDAATKDILIIAYANEEALRYTLEHKIAAFWSTSRNELWVKGKTSGDTLAIVDVYVNCDQNSLVYAVTMQGTGSCHVRDEKGQTRFGCYYRKIKDGRLEFLS
jgi:phosphoribosyl-AMP cyclohydrolase